MGKHKFVFNCDIRSQIHYLVSHILNQRHLQIMVTPAMTTPIEVTIFAVFLGGGTVKRSVTWEKVIQNWKSDTSRCSYLEWKSKQEKVVKKRYRRIVKLLNSNENALKLTWYNLALKALVWRSCCRPCKKCISGVTCSTQGQSPQWLCTWVGYVSDQENKMI